MTYLIFSCYAANVIYQNPQVHIQILYTKIGMILNEKIWTFATLCGTVMYYKGGAIWHR